MYENFSLEHTLHLLQHHLPSQAPLKDFIHHNTLHGFQSHPFHEGLALAQETFGYQTYPSIAFYRKQYAEGNITEPILERVLAQHNKSGLKTAMLHQAYDQTIAAQVGSLRVSWKQAMGFDLDTNVHPILFRLVSSYLDQGIAIWKFPAETNDFLAALRSLELGSISSLFESKRARQLFLDQQIKLTDLLQLLVGDASAYEAYLLDQQFAHPGYSGMVAQIEARPNALVEQRNITLEAFIFLECLLEIDALDRHFNKQWKSVASYEIPSYTFKEIKRPFKEILQLKALWQEAYEWSYYDQVLAGLKHKEPRINQVPKAQGIFCIDDRECSIRRHIEGLHPGFETFGTPGHFNIETYFQPEGSSHRTKICPAPLQPTHLITEKSVRQEKTAEWHFAPGAFGLVMGWILTHTYGFWSAFKLALSIFKPSMNKMAVSSGQHMHAEASLSIEYQGSHSPDGLKIGFSLDEMTQIVASLFKSIGLTKEFAPLVYIVSHGSSSANNTHYAGYDCGACSGRPGSVNARAFAYMANHLLVREAIKAQAIFIPEQTHFVPVLHDTCRDEFTYFDLSQVPLPLLDALQADRQYFSQALDANAVERSRRFITLNKSVQYEAQHDKVKLRSVSLFEPRPELNHATNSLCIVGRRSFSRNLFLDRRSFLNSYDFQQDPNGQILEGILNAVAPVCGGINLEYYFSRVDNQQLGAGTKLPHNVMGLFGVANGIDGDLRTGLPSQMIEVHDPYRLLVIVEQVPAVVMAAIQRNAATWEWFKNEWVRLVSFDVTNDQFYVLQDGQFEVYNALNSHLRVVDDVLPLLAATPENFPIVQLKQKAS